MGEGEVAPASFIERLTDLLQLRDSSREVFGQFSRPLLRFEIRIYSRMAIARESASRCETLFGPDCGPPRMMRTTATMISDPANSSSCEKVSRPSVQPSRTAMRGVT